MYHTAQLWPPHCAVSKESNTNISEAIVSLYLIDCFQLRDLILGWLREGKQWEREEQEQKEGLQWDSLPQKKTSFAFYSAAWSGNDNQIKLVFKRYISVSPSVFHWRADTEWSTSKMNMIGSHCGSQMDYSRHFHSTGPSFSSQIQSWMPVFSSVPKLL